jgi:hypothetical protein
MSTYYFAICTQHAEVSEIVARQALIGDWSASNENLAAFLEEHGSCKPLIVTEHDERVFEYRDQKAFHPRP